MGLHPLTIIIAVMVGTTLLGGILGGILAIPADGGAWGADVPLRLEEAGSENMIRNA